MKRRAVLSLVLAAVATACSKFQTYRGPEVTRIHVLKGQRRMYLMHHDEVLKAYDIGLGFAPVGHKQFEGDGKTPEGAYIIDRRNPNSKFHLSIGVSYPNPDDMAFAEEQGRSPGATSSSMASRASTATPRGTGPPAASPSPIRRWRRSTPWWATAPRSSSTPDPGSDRRMS